MPIEVESSSLEARILRILLEVYPISVSELKGEMGVSTGILERALKALQSRGIIELERLPDNTFIRLLRTDISFIGRKATQRKRFKRRGRRPRESEYNGIMFG